MVSVEERSVWRRKGGRLSPVSWRDVETLSVVSLTLYSVIHGGGYSMATYSQLYIVTTRTVRIPGDGHDSPSLSLPSHKSLTLLHHSSILDGTVHGGPAGPPVYRGWKENYQSSETDLRL